MTSSAGASSLSESRTLIKVAYCLVVPLALVMMNAKLLADHKHTVRSFYEVTFSRTLLVNYWHTQMTSSFKCKNVAMVFRP